MQRFDFRFISKDQSLSSVSGFAEFLPKDPRQWLAVWGGPTDDGVLARGTGEGHPETGQLWARDEREAG